MELTYEQETVLSHIPANREDRISKAELNELCGYTDRKVRKILSELRREGYPIINIGRGLWLADPENESDLDAIESYHKIMRATAIAYFEALKPMRRILLNKGRSVR